MVSGLAREAYKILQKCFKRDGKPHPGVEGGKGEPDITEDIREKFLRRRKLSVC